MEIFDYQELTVDSELSPEELFEQIEKKARKEPSFYSVMAGDRPMFFSQIKGNKFKVMMTSPESVTMHSHGDKSHKIEGTIESAPGGSKITVRVPIVTYDDSGGMTASVGMLAVIVMMMGLAGGMQFALMTFLAITVPIALVLGLQKLFAYLAGPVEDDEQNRPPSDFERRQKEREQLKTLLFEALDLDTKLLEIRRDDQ